MQRGRNMRKRIIVAALATIIAAALAGCGEKPQKELPEKLTEADCAVVFIDSGKTAARLGMTEAQLEETLGPRKDKAENVTIYGSISQDSGTMMYFYTMADTVKTPRGIQIGDQYQDVLDAYGSDETTMELEMAENDTWALVTYDSGNGYKMIFKIDSNTVIGMGALTEEFEQQTQGTWTPPDAVDQDANGTAITPEPAETMTYTGSGDDVLTIAPPDDQIWLLYARGNSAGQYFAVKGYDDDMNSTELFVNTASPYDGTTIDYTQRTTTLQVEASGDWTIEIRSVYTAPIIAPGESMSGTGDEVVLLAGWPQTAHITGNAGATYFGVKTCGTISNELLVNTDDPYDGTVLMKGDPYLMAIRAADDWTIELNS